MLTHKQIAVFEQIGNIIEEAWDEAEVAQAIEYEEYLPQIFSLKENNASIEVIAQKLFEIQNQRFRHEASLIECRVVAEKIGAL